MIVNKLKRMKRNVYFAIKKIKIELLSVNAKINAAPVFILGNQKSGTSAIAALLAAATGYSVTIDLTKEWIYERKSHLLLKENKCSFESFLNWNKLDFSRDIIKEANLSLFYDELNCFFPDAKYVFIVRDPRTNIRSILNRLNLPGDLKHLSLSEYKQKIPTGWKTVIDGSWLGLNGENYVDMLAKRWNYMTDVYKFNRSKMILVRYEDFLIDKTGVISMIAKDLNLNFKYDISNKVDIQYQPRGNPVVDLNLFFGNDNMSIITKECKQNMDYFGYNI